MKKQIDVVGAVIVKDGKVLCAQRGPEGELPFKWEFPGGQLQSGETPRQALEREIDEELVCVVEVGTEVESTTYEYDFAIITLTTFYCEFREGDPQLTEYAQIVWSTPAALQYFDWAPADLPAVSKICQDLSA